jgi:hypothetical protein
MEKKSRNTTNIVKQTVNKTVSEGKLASSWLSHLRSLLSGEERKSNFTKVWAAYNQPKEKSPGLTPRNIRSEYGAKHNAKLNLKNQVELPSNMISESYNELKIERATGYGTFLTAKDIGIKFQSAFEHHPSVEEELKKKNEKCQCKACKCTE